MFPAILGQALAATALSTPPQSAGKPESVPRQRAELVRFVKAFNRAWTLEPNEAALRGSVHPSCLKTGGARLEARLELARAAQVVDWKEADVHVELYSGGQVAIVRYSFELALAAHGQIAERRGRELLVLVRESNAWWIVADAATDESETAGASGARETVPGPKPHGSRIPAKHHAAPRWIECDYTPESDLRIA